MRLTHSILLAALIAIFWSIPVSAQTGFGPYEYVSPRPDAILVNAGTTIAVRHGDEINPSSLSAELFTVTGDASGVITGTVLLADDSKTVIFTPSQPFTPEESVSVVLNGGLKTTDGLMLDEVFSYNFTVSSVAPLQASWLAPNDNQYNFISPATTSADQMMSTVPLTGTQSYATLPARYPHISVTVPANGADDGYIFAANLTRRSPFPHLLILENSGEPIFYRAMNEGMRYRDLRVQPNGLLTYASQPDFSFHAMDNSYRIVHKYKAGNGYQADFHGLQINDEGNALIQIYDHQPVDMSQIVEGGLVTATVVGALVQEIDPSGNVIFEWRSWDHFDILDAADRTDFTATSVSVTHINSAEWDRDGNILMSFRSLDEITKISRTSADVIWRFGGKKNQFTLTDADQDGIEFFSHQHDARRQESGTLTLYDNGNIKTPPYSRAVEFELDEENLIATQIWQYRNVPDFFGAATGNMQQLPNGNRIIGWGGAGINEHIPFITEVKPDGTKAFEAKFVQNESSYRTFRFPWEGRPFEPPTLAASSLGETTHLHYSWNGATNVASYDIYGGSSTDPADFTKLANQPKAGFETTTEMAGSNESCYFYSVVPIEQDGVQGIPSNLLFGGDDSCGLVATVDGASATAVTLDAPETTSTISITAPAGVVSGTVTLVLDDILTPTQPLLDDAQLVMAFTLEAQSNGSVLPNFSFDKPISLTVNYAAAAAAELDEATLDVRYWHSRQQEWLTDGIAVTGQSTETNQITFTTDHLSLFALFAQSSASDNGPEEVVEVVPNMTELLIDGSFELASDSPWVYDVESDVGETTPFSCFGFGGCGYGTVGVHDGESIVFLGLFTQAEKTTITQEFESPPLAADNTAGLSLWIMRSEVEGADSVDFTGNNSIKVFLNDTELISITDLALVDDEYVEFTADVTDLLTDTNTLLIEGDFEAQGGAIYIDDVTIQVSAPYETYMPFIGNQ